jgi:hypothetical protein
MPKGIRGSSPKCAVRGCERPSVARGWCSAHYQRWKAHGDPLGGGPAAPHGRSAAERFWPRVRKTASCWIWEGSRRRGYGQFSFNGRPVAAYRWAYEALRGPVPAGMELDHLCRNPSCVNPDHMEPVSHRENVLRGDAPTARHARKTHCKRGHPFDEANTHVARDGSRTCRICAREGNRRRYKPQLPTV